MIGIAGFQHCQGHFAVALLTRRLEDWLFVGRKPQPRKPFENGVDGFLCGPLAIRIFDPKQVFSAMVTGIEPVEQGRPRTANMQEAGRRGSKTCDDGHGGAILTEKMWLWRPDSISLD